MEADMINSLSYIENKGVAVCHGMSACVQMVEEMGGGGEMVRVSCNSFWAMWGMIV